MKITKLSYKNLIIAIVILLVSVTVTLSGCGSQKGETDNPSQTTSSDVSANEDIENDDDVEEHKKLTVSNGHLSLSARSFVRLFDAAENNYTYTKMDGDASLFYELTKTDDSNKRPQNVGMMSFAKDADKALSAKEESTENVITKINIFIEKSDDVQPILAGCMCAADPNLKLNTASDLAEDVVKKAGKNDGYVRNGVNFAVKADGEYYYIIISIAKTPVTENKAENTTVANTGANATTHNAGTNTTKPNSGGGTGSKAPSSKAEIVNYFNTAVNKVKTGAKTVEQKSVTNYLANAKTISSSIQGIYNMLGGDEWLYDMLKDNSQGSATYTGATIKAKFPVESESYASKLTATDVASASCTERNGVYTIKITTVADAKSEGHKHGQGHAPKAFNVILPGVVNDNIPGAAKSMVGTASIAYPSSTATITVDAKTGNVLTAEYNLRWTINFDKVGVIIPLGTKSVYTIKW